MKLTRISEEELVAIRTSVYQDEDRYKYAGNCIVTAAQAQLEADQRELYEEIVRLNKEAQEKVREVVEGAKLSPEKLDAITEEVDSHYENPMADRYEAIAEAQLQAILKALKED